MTDTWWCEHAWLSGDSVADGVLFTVADGRITAIELLGDADYLGQVELTMLEA